MEIDAIKDAVSEDSDEMKEAIWRGLIAAYGSLDDVEPEFSGHVMGTIRAVRAAVVPLLPVA